MKIPDRNNRGRIVAFTTAGAASALGITDVTASPSAEKVAAPTTTVTMNAGSVLVVTCAP